MSKYDYVELDFPDRETEMMICMKEQGYSLTLDGKTISFPLDVMMDMWDILRHDAQVGKGVA